MGRLIFARLEDGTETWLDESEVAGATVNKSWVGISNYNEPVTPAVLAPNATIGYPVLGTYLPEGGSVYDGSDEGAVIYLEGGEADGTYHEGVEALQDDYFVIVNTDLDGSEGGDRGFAGINVRDIGLWFVTHFISGTKPGNGLILINGYGSVSGVVDGDSWHGVSGVVSSDDYNPTDHPDGFPLVANIGVTNMSDDDYTLRYVGFEARRTR